MGAQSGGSGKSHATKTRGGEADVKKPPAEKQRDAKEKALDQGLEESFPGPTRSTLPSRRQAKKTRNRANDRR